MSFIIHEHRAVQKSASPERNQPEGKAQTREQPTGQMNLGKMVGSWLDKKPIEGAAAELKKGLDGFFAPKR